MHANGLQPKRETERERAKATKKKWRKIKWNSHLSCIARYRLSSSACVLHVSAICRWPSIAWPKQLFYYFNTRTKCYIVSSSDDSSQQQQRQHKTVRFFVSLWILKFQYHTMDVCCGLCCLWRTLQVLLFMHTLKARFSRKWAPSWYRDVPYMAMPRWHVAH